MDNPITVNGVHLFWKMTGDSGEPVVLVHGSWVDHHTFDTLVPALAQSFKILTYDRRGHSQSQRDLDADSIHHDVADLAALLEMMDFAPAHIVGNSFGGTIALHLAIERPDLFRSMTIHEPPLLGLLQGDPVGLEMLEETNKRMGAVVELLTSGDVEGGAQQFTNTVAIGPGAWDKLSAAIQNTFVSNVTTFLNELQDPDAFGVDLAQLSAFPHPVLLTHSDNGIPFMKIVMEKLAGALPQAERYEYVNADHVPQNSQPEACSQSIWDFVTKVSNKG